VEHKVMGITEIYTGSWLVNLNKKGHLEDLGTNGKQC